MQGLLTNILMHSQVVIGHFPDGGLDTVNSAIFLRFINPAIGKKLVIFSTINLYYNSLFV